VAAGESRRLAALLDAWVARCELPRAPFAVLASEEEADITLAGLTFGVRLDRVDRVAGGVAVLDYKSGRVPAPSTWLEPRPRAPQLGLYLLARRRHAAPELPVRAVAYGQLKLGKISVRGNTAAREIWPALTPFADDWGHVDAWWRAELEALAAEIRAGVARVDPRDGGKTCAQCHLAALCRVRAAGGPFATDFAAAPGTESGDE
jgi:hypothetical protein